MKIKLYDRVLLKTGEEASIVEIYENGEAFEADIDSKDGKTYTDTIFPKDISKII